MFCFSLACIKIPVGTTRSRSCSFEYYLEAMHARWFCSSWTYSNSLTVTSTVNSKCNYQTTCNLQATTSWLGGDPCPGHTTYLEWRDTCYCKWLFKLLFYCLFKRNLIFCYILYNELELCFNNGSLIFKINISLYIWLKNYSKNTD